MGHRGEQERQRQQASPRMPSMGSMAAWLLRQDTHVSGAELGGPPPDRPVYSLCPIVAPFKEFACNTLVSNLICSETSRDERCWERIVWQTKEPRLFTQLNHRRHQCQPRPDRRCTGPHTLGQT